MATVVKPYEVSKGESRYLGFFEDIFLAETVWSKR